MAIVQDEDVKDLMDALGRKGRGATRLGSSGGFLRTGNSTVIVGTQDERPQDVMHALLPLGLSLTA